MKKIFFWIIFLLLIFKTTLYCKKILIIQIQSINNYSIDTYYYDYTEIDSIFFSNFKCKKYEIPYKYSIKEIVNFLINTSGKVESKTEVLNFSSNDKVVLKNILVLDSKYKILEKEGKKYYIFNVCYPGNKKSIIKKIFKWLM